MKLTSFFIRCQFCFQLNALVIVEVNVLIKEEARLLLGGRFVVVKPLGFEGAKEIFGTSIVKWRSGA